MRLRNVFKEQPHGVLFLRDYPLGGEKRSMANETNTRWAVPAGGRGGGPQLWESKQGGALPLPGGEMRVRQQLPPTQSF